MRIRAILFVLAVTVPATAVPVDEGLKISVRDTWAGRLTGERTQYIQGDRRRSDYRNSSGSSYGPPLASVTRCDLGQVFELNLEDRQYVSGPLQKFPSEGELKARAASSAQTVPRRSPTILIEITTVDTGERKKLFGYEARHVTTTRKQTALNGDKNSESVSVTDGWYTDLATALSCEPHPRPGAVYLVFATMKRINAKDDEMPVPTFKLVGKQESGFALYTKTTTHETSVMPDGSKRDWDSTSEMQVTELYSGPLNPQLFEVPAGFRKVDQIRRNPDVPLSTRMLWYWNELKLRFSRVFH